MVCEVGSPPSFEIPRLFVFIEPHEVGEQVLPVNHDLGEDC